MIMISPAQPPEDQLTAAATSSPPPSKLPVDFSPPLIAMVVIIATAFVIVTYSRLISTRLIHLHRRYRRWRRRRHLLRSYLPSSSPASSSPPYDSFFDPSATDLYGLDDSVIKTIPLSLYTAKSTVPDCAVCLIEFEENEYVRTLPVCFHVFHIDCIDVWLKSHANCPLCRAGIFRPEESPFIPVMAARIRPSLDSVVIEGAMIGPLMEGSVTDYENVVTDGEEIVQEIVGIGSEDNHRFLLKRSYSFGFERNLGLGSERLMMMEPATASPWRYRRGGGFWGKRPSPFSSMMKPRVFSFRYYRGMNMNMKSPFFRRRSSGGGLFPLSERFSAGGGGGGGGGSSRRSKSMTSPTFMRSSGGFFSSSRLRSGDPEALLSPERFNRR